MVLWNRSVVDAVGMLAEAGFESVEVWHEHLQRSGERSSAVARALAASGLACTVHCPIVDVNICSTNPAMAEASLGQYLRALETAAELDARLFVFHPGNLFSAWDPLDAYWERLASCLQRVLEAARAPLEVVVENMEADKPNEVVKSAADLARALAEAKPAGGAGVSEGAADAAKPATSAQPGLCWDTTHLITTQANEQFLAAVGRVDHVHLSDASVGPDGAARKHLRLGRGELDLRRLLAHPRAREAGIVSLETVLVDPAPADLAEERARLQEALGA
jgi:sugar phosphate isomerase/epimerase